MPAFTLFTACYPSDSFFLWTATQEAVWEKMYHLHTVCQKHAKTWFFSYPYKATSQNKGSEARRCWVHPPATVHAGGVPCSSHSSSPLFSSRPSLEKKNKTKQTYKAHIQSKKPPAIQIPECNLLQSKRLRNGAAGGSRSELDQVYREDFMSLHAFCCTSKKFIFFSPQDIFGTDKHSATDFYW